MSFRSLARSTLLLGSSSAATAIIGILRVKAVSLLVGPAGLGLLGTLGAIASAGTTLAALGCDTSGMRRLAAERHDPAAAWRLRQALLLVAVVHGAVVLAAMACLSEPLSRLILGSEAFARDVGLAGVAVALSLFAGLQIAQIQGLGRVRDLARINILASLIGSLFGVAAVWQLGPPGLIILVLAQPAAAVLLATQAARSALAPAPERVRPDLAALGADWRRLVVEGAPYMVSFLLVALVPLAIRALLIGELGMEAAGHFHAAWTLSVLYIGVLLNPMTADFFPRLAAAVGDRRAAAALINDQAQLGLAIGGVAVLALLAGAPLLVPLLYSGAFAPAVGIVEWLALGNLMKIAMWPIGFLAMARGRSLQFLAIEIVWNGLFLALAWLLLPVWGLAAAGIAFAVASLVSLCIQTVVGARTYGFAWSAPTLRLLLAQALAGALILAAARHSEGLQMIAGAVLVPLLGVASLRLVCSRIGGEGPIAGLAATLFNRIGWPLSAGPSSSVKAVTP